MLRTGNSRGRYWTGIILIILGSLFLLDKLGYLRLDFGRIFATWWPSLIILWALLRMMRGETGRWSGAMFWLIVGVVLQIGQFNLMPWWAVDALWPLLLIFAGVWLLVRRLAW